jgi:hypothetical protein
MDLFNTEMNFNDPIVTVDKHRLYPRNGEVSVGDMGYGVKYNKPKWTIKSSLNNRF